MLKKIPNILSPDLLKTLHEMGHGDEIVIGDGNFPAANYAKRLIRCDGHDIPSLLDAVLQLLPVDDFVAKPITLMEVVDKSAEKAPAIWNSYENILNHHEISPGQIGYEERFDFYERSKEAYAIIATTETALYGNIILKKGVIS
ncbi:RbsD/FucU family protein [Saliterribacillus persicus]|uniref:L-fucose mutarotase n=1 Tax=Saliterribacillus persicus TaxID=930114 RepID=A0A368YAK0_9BACI|nr:RbsD/FucU domain-containing protein [Saliterribacillus persicus]RCW77232.1 L-fucose mutarotase [Saliterribacillus persicus]